MFSIAIPILYPDKTVDKFYLITEDSSLDCLKIGNIRELFIYKMSTVKFLNVVQNSSLPVVMNLNKVFPIPGINFEHTKKLYNLFLSNQNWYVGFGSELSNYVKAARSVKSECLFIPMHVLHKVFDNYIKETEEYFNNLGVTTVADKMMQNEFKASLGICAKPILYKQKTGDTKELYFNIKLNNSSDGWSMYPLMSLEKEKRKNIIPSLPESSIYLIDYRAFMLTTVLHLIGQSDIVLKAKKEEKSLYDILGNKRDMIVLLNGNFLIKSPKDFHVHPDMNLNMPDELLAKICQHKNEVIEKKQNDHIYNNFGFMVNISEANEPYIIYSYYIRSVLAFIIKAVIYEVFKTICEKHSGQARIITNIFDTIMVEIVDKQKDEILKLIKNVMEKPLSQYGYDWEYAVTENKVN